MAATLTSISCRTPFVIPNGLVRGLDSNSRATPAEAFVEARWSKVQCGS